MKNILLHTKAYNSLLQEIVTTIHRARIKTATLVNREQVTLFYQIGKIITQKQAREGWGKGIVEQLAKDIEKQLCITEGFSPRNLWFMKQFYEEYKTDAFLKQVVSELKLKQVVSELPVDSRVLGLLPWGHHLLLMQKTERNRERIFYITAAIQQGWSRNVLLNQIKIDAYKHQQRLPKQHNFTKTLPKHLSRQADEMLKSTYNLDFLGITTPIHERQLEHRLIEKIKQFILELGNGFSFIGNQYRLVLKGKEYFIDLLFYQRSLKCLVAIDLKIGVFEPEFAGKMNFYLNLLDDTVRLKDENPSIGIILCADKNSIEVEYALRGIHKPIAVAEYHLRKKIPAKLQKQLPTIKELQAVIKNELQNK